MSREFDTEQVFLQIGFRSSEREGRLRSIELFGVPGEKLDSGECRVSGKTQQFFDDLIVRKIFHDSCRLPDCNFEHLKIWLCDTDARDGKRGYEIPRIDDQDLEICSDVTSSRLEYIYILDNALTGSEYEIWKRTARDLFSPLFGRFIVSPEPPDILRNLPLVRFLEDMAEKFDPYLRMRQTVFFSALIIQID